MCASKCVCVRWIRIHSQTIFTQQSRALNIKYSLTNPRFFNFCLCAHTQFLMIFLFAAFRCCSIAFICVCVCLRTYYMGISVRLFVMLYSCFYCYCCCVSLIQIFVPSTKNLKKKNDRAVKRERAGEQASKHKKIQFLFE